jgi:glycosyltransferase involved in cell wall biosynthesis
MTEILTISTDKTRCGIAEYYGHLRESSPETLIYSCDPAWLSPEIFFEALPKLRQYQGPQVVWLNYHAALHSQWNPEQITRLQQAGMRVVITYHDTGVPNSEQCRRLWGVTRTGIDAFVIHEPADDLPGAIYLRQGVPPAQGAIQFDQTRRLTPSHDPVVTDHQLTFPWNFAGGRPILGTVGFPFPWKNYDLLAEATALAGWGLLLIAPGTYSGHKTTPLDHDVERWQALNPWLAVEPNFISSQRVVSYLSGCDATAFLYMCANTGTSAAIRQGLAARKPLLATEGCRQFRDLEEVTAIHWLENLSPEGVARALAQVPITRMDAGIHRIAERDSWTTQAQRYTDIFEEVARCGS